MAKMTQGDFSYLRNKIFSDKKYHEKEFLQRIDPDLIDAYFEGDPDENYKNSDNTRIRLSLNKIFPSTTTLLTQLYPTNPKFVPTKKKGVNELDALISTSAMNYFYKEMNALKENQLAIMSAWLYGFGATKQGWRTVFKKTEPSGIDPTQQESTNFFDRMKGIFTGGVQTEEEENSEYIASDGPFLNYINNKNLYFDKDQMAGRGKFITQMIPKTLAEIRQSGMYQVDDDFYNRFNRGKDERECNVTLYEQYSWVKDSMYLFVMCDGYDKPLRFDKLQNFSEGFPIKVLRFNLQPNRVYEISHMKVAQQAQRMVDYILRLQKEKIEKFKDLTIFTNGALDADSMAKVLRNETDANLITKPGISASSAAYGITSNAIPTDMFNVQSLLENNIREILSVSGARVGTSESKTLGQEQMIDAGNQLRSMGLQERTHEFMLSQGKKLKQDMAQFATGEMLFQVTGMNAIDPMTGQNVTDEWIELGSERSPKTLKDVVPKDLDFDIDVTEFARRDVAVVRKQLTDVFSVVMNPVVQQSLAMEGKKISVSELIKDTLKSFETLGDAEKYIVDIQQPANANLPMAGTPQAIPSPGNLNQGSGEITPESILNGAIDTGGM